MDPQIWELVGKAGSPITGFLCYACYWISGRYKEEREENKRLNELLVSDAKEQLKIYQNDNQTLERIIRTLGE